MRSFWPQYMRPETEGTEGKILSAKVKSHDI